MTEVSTTVVLSADMVAAAAVKIRPAIVHTPLLRSEVLDRLSQGRIVCKAENLQRSGSFKLRGATNRMRQLSAAESRRGVVAFSAGNHAQAVALVGRERGIPVTMVMPSDAPRAKIARTRALGAAVVLYDRAVDDREAIANRIAVETGAVLLPPYDDPAVMVGGGTMMVEVFNDLGSRGMRPDVVLVPCGGGGLIAGCATYAKARDPAVQIFAVEPTTNADMGQSLRAGGRVRLASASQSICDALLTATPGRLTFPICSALLAGAIAVTDLEVARAMAFAFTELACVLEPGGAAALAAVLSGALDCRGRTVCVVLSGGNVDASTFARVALAPPLLATP